MVDNKKVINLIVLNRGVMRAAMRSHTAYGRYTFEDAAGDWFGPGIEDPIAALWISRCI